MVLIYYVVIVLYISIMLVILYIIGYDRRRPALALQCTTIYEPWYDNHGIYSIYKGFTYRIVDSITNGLALRKISGSMSSTV